jgi:chemotaxis protein histidine kinase CheA
MNDVVLERLGRVRARFIASLNDKIRETYDAIPHLAASYPAVGDVIGETYRRIHNIVGVGATIGFAETGRAAHAVESILLAPQRAARGLTDAEICDFGAALDHLRETAARELEVDRPTLG